MDFTPSRLQKGISGFSPLCKSLTGRSMLLIAAGMAAAVPAFAQDNAQARQIVEEIVVTGQNVYRDRTADINPTLSYGLDFFQRFEPLTVGEMLKRTPGVVFTSDVLEYDAVQLRGLGAEYTQVMINGRRVPGQGADRTFFVDRIPSELVERIEIIRSPSADMSAEGIAGTLNIILKDGAQLEGILARLNNTYYGDGDGENRQTGALAIADSGDGYDYWLGFNYQERRNPKRKVEEYFDDSALEGYAFEEDTRDGDDLSFNGSGGWQTGNGEIRVNGYFVNTDRLETEFVDEFEGTVVSRTSGDLVESATQRENIDQDTWGIDGLWTIGLGNGGGLELSAAWSSFKEDTFNVETEEEFEDGISQGIEEGTESLFIEDDNFMAEVAWILPLGEMLELKTGVAWQSSEREGVQAGFFDIDAMIEETRVSPYGQLTWDNGAGFSVKGGLRFAMYDRDISNEDGSGSQDGDELLPSLSLRWDLNANDRITASVARTLRRPQFDLVSPFEEDETPDDEHLTIGNPDLDSELSMGFDIGYEHRLDNGGIMGVNFFYRDIQDLIEITDTGVPYPDGGGSVFTALNIGDGEARGVEFDISTPLAFMGLPNTGFYANYTWMDSEVLDPFTGANREFRDQPGFVYNLSLTQDLPMLNGGAGISWQKRDNSLATEFQEYVILEYDANLELFVEFNMKENMVVRFSGTNLLDQEKVEYFRAYGEAISEIQYESSSPTYSLTVRASF
jgi:outer membrane receptor protein involved in Fe transport